MTVQTTQAQEARISSAPKVNNLLINPGFEIWQRGAGPFTVTSAGYFFTADEWAIHRGDSTSFSVSRNSVPLTGDYCAQVTLSGWTGPNWGLMKQGIEPASARSLEGKYLTFSAWVKTDFERRCRLAIFDYASSGGVAFSSYHTGDSTWQRLTVIKEIQTGLTSDSDAPHNFPLSAVLTVENSGVVYIDSAVVVEGYFPEGVPFVPPNPSDDLARSQRFYYADSGYQSSHIFRGDVISGYNYFVDKVYKTPMYATPTITKTGGNEAGFSATSNFHISPWGLIEYRESTATASARFFWTNISAEVS